MICIVVVVRLLLVVLLVSAIRVAAFLRVPVVFLLFFSLSHIVFFLAHLLSLVVEITFTAVFPVLLGTALLHAL